MPKVSFVSKGEYDETKNTKSRTIKLIAFENDKAYIEGKNYHDHRYARPFVGYQHLLSRSV